MQNTTACIKHAVFWKKVTWDQALFSFRFENYIPAGKAKRKESPNFSGGR